MPLLTVAVQSQQPDYLALAMVLALLLTVAVAVVRKRLRAAHPTAAPAAEPTPATLAPGSAGQLKLHDVDPKTAAMAMAIVADRLGKPLNELRFISIKEVTEK